MSSLTDKKLPKPISLVTMICPGCSQEQDLMLDPPIETVKQLELFIRDNAECPLCFHDRRSAQFHLKA